MDQLRPNLSFIYLSIGTASFIRQTITVQEKYPRKRLPVSKLPAVMLLSKRRTRKYKESFQLSSCQIHFAQPKPKPVTSSTRKSCVKAKKPSKAPANQTHYKYIFTSRCALTTAVAWIDFDSDLPQDASHDNELNLHPAAQPSVQS